MFSLIKFHNEKIVVVQSKTVQQMCKKTCLVKYKGAKYSAFFVAKSDFKSKLLDQKQKLEEKLIRSTKLKQKLEINSSRNADLHYKPKSNESKATLSHSDHIGMSDNISPIGVKDNNIDENLPNEANSSNAEPFFGSKMSEKLSQAELKNYDVHFEKAIIHTSDNTFTSATASTSTTLDLTNNANIQLHDVHFEKAIIHTSDNTFTSATASTSTTLDLTNNANIQFHSTATLENTSQAESFIDLSSACADRSSDLTYVPDLSATTSKGILDVSTELSIRNESINLVDNPVNIKKIVVPYSKDKAKKHFCCFCKTLQSKIGRHLLLMHKKEAEIKKALSLPKRSKERLKIIDKIRKQGDFEHNTSANHNTGFLIVSRRQQSKCKNIPDDYVCCKNCKGFFSKRTISIHVSVCCLSKAKRTNLIEGRRLTQYIHSAASNAMKTKIFPVLRNDDVTRSIRYDELVIKYGNKLAEKYSSEHQHDMIRANLRLLGRFIIEVKALDSQVTELKDIFKPHLFDKCVAALRTVANWEETDMQFRTPAVAQNLTSLIKKCAKKQRAELIKYDSEESKAELENFLLLWEEEIPTLINKKAFEDQANKKRIKKVVLPSKEDIKTLYMFLKKKILCAIENLCEEFRLTTWTDLVQATLIFVQIFNRRRAGEIERLTTENFANKEIITDNIDKDFLKHVSNDSLKFAQQFVRISLRGKLGRTVSVLLCPMSIKAIDLILKYRLNAGIGPKNNYIFSKPTTTNLAKSYYRACPLLNRFSTECGAKMPESLRGTTLRKHIATYTSLLNVEEGSIDKLANFMGHDKDIHKNIYRISIPVAEITCVSKLLMAAVGDENVEEEDDDDDSVKDIEADIEADIGAEENIGQNESSSSSTKKRRSTSPFGKTKRHRWTDGERKAIHSVFGDLENLEKLPSLHQCINAIRESPILKSRTPQQIKSWIDNQRRH